MCVCGGGRRWRHPDSWSSLWLALCLLETAIFEVDVIFEVDAVFEVDAIFEVDALAIKA